MTVDASKQKIKHVLLFYLEERQTSEHLHQNLARRHRPEEESHLHQILEGGHRLQLAKEFFNIR
jgi:hypothetical protein